MFLAAKMNEFEYSTCTICLTGTLSKLSIQVLGFTACTVVTFALKPARVFSKMIIDFPKSSESIRRRSFKVPFFLLLDFCCILRVISEEKPIHILRFQSWSLSASFAGPNSLGSSFEDGIRVPFNLRVVRFSSYVC